MPNTTLYEYENSEYWDVRAWLYPACTVTPGSAAEVSTFVKNFSAAQVPFAIRGGGHMPIAGTNNINSTGILIAADNLTALALSTDQQTLSIGPGNRWVNVYEYLAPYGLLVPGGRIGLVGVAGYMLGGGMSFLSGQYGFCLSSVKALEIVLANGDIVTATAENEYSDLFWAIRGGGNSFGIVTRFDVQTYSAPYTYVGFNTYSPTYVSQWLDAIYNFGAYGQVESPNAAIIPISTWNPLEGPLPTPNAIVFYDSKTPLGGLNATGLQNFTAPTMIPTASTYVQQTMFEWAEELDVGLVALKGWRQGFYAVSAINAPDTVQIIHDTYMQTAMQMLANVTDIMVELALQPVSKHWIEMSNNVTGGNPFGLDASKAPYVFVDESLSWLSPSDDATIENFVQIANQKVNAALDAKGLRVPFVYVNDADGGQAIFQGYGEENVKKLQSIREKYDPERIYTDMMPGGWKVADIEA
ncbi:MAG: hypothetical protein M1821_010000 [Bathelium mastoideum]|nr:MAG: hypothetical protein M1821_010000 [Bathelium mastoideum]